MTRAHARALGAALHPAAALLVLPSLNLAASTGSCKCYTPTAHRSAGLPRRGLAAAAAEAAVATTPRPARPAPRAPDVHSLVAGILEGQRLAVSRSITLSESTNPAHQLQASQLLLELQRRAEQGTAGLASEQHEGLLAGSHTPGSFRIGVSGPPGAGKSSLIEALGCAMLEAGDRVAVLAIDPSSEQSGGAILGDKTRMPRLSANPSAYVRPSPARGTLGGVARATSDAIIICEAAGYNKVLVETVGVGQNETAVAGLVDCVLLVMPPVGGDELQVIKRGITEVADIVAVNKADGPTRAAAAKAATQFKSTMHFHRSHRRSWVPTVLTCSAHTGTGVEKLQHQLDEFRLALSLSGELAQGRQLQRRQLAWAATEEAVIEGLRSNPNVRQLFERIWPDIRTGQMAPRTAADLLAQTYAEYD